MSDDRSVILERMLSSIDSTLDKSVGSFIYDSLAASSIELENLYKQEENILTKGFADTATDKDLERIVSEVGISRKGSTKASGYVTITGINGSKIVKGEKVATDSLNYLFLEDKVIENKTIDVLVECEIDGADGNIPAGAIKYFPKTLQGLQTVTNKGAFKNGYDTEDDDSLRERYYIKVRTPAASGNVYHYALWSKEVTGVGDCKVMPLWNGNGTVKVVIINANKVGADSLLISTVKQHIEENRPIGATVTVVSATEIPININFNLNIESSHELEATKEKIKATIKNYLKEIAFNREYVSIAKIGAFILDTDGVIDYTGLKVNGGTDNIRITNEQVAILGEVTVNG